MKMTEIFPLLQHFCTHFVQHMNLAPEEPVGCTRQQKKWSTKTQLQNYHHLETRHDVPRWHWKEKVNGGCGLFYHSPAVSRFSLGAKKRRWCIVANHVPYKKQAPILQGDLWSQRHRFFLQWKINMHEITLQSHISYNVICWLSFNNFKASKRIWVFIISLIIITCFCSAAVKNRQNKHERNHGRKEELLERNQTKALFKKQLKLPNEDWILAHHIIYRPLKEKICHCQTTLSSRW